MLPLQSQHVTPCDSLSRERNHPRGGLRGGLRGDGPAAVTGPGICPSTPNSLNLEQFPLFPSNRETPRGWGPRPLHRSEAVSTGSTGSTDTCRRDPQAGTPRGSHRLHVTARAFPCVWSCAKEQPGQSGPLLQPSPWWGRRAVLLGTDARRSWVKATRGRSPGLPTPGPSKSPKKASPDLQAAFSALDHRRAPWRSG